VLKEAQSMINGIGRRYHRKTEEGRDMYRLVVFTPPRVKEMVELVKPFVRVKAEDLKCLDEAVDKILELRGTGTKVKWTVEAQKEFIELAQKSRALRGSSRKIRGRPRKSPEVPTLESER
jgi:hypothetical protein